LYLKAFLDKKKIFIFFNAKILIYWNPNYPTIFELFIMRTLDVPDLIIEFYIQTLSYFLVEITFFNNLKYYLLIVNDIFKYLLSRYRLTM